MFMAWARAEDTAAFVEKFEEKLGSSVLGRTGLTVSSIGFGSYRINEYEPEHREALRHALVNGVNLIDTSSNYTDGSSERLIGDVLNELFAANRLRREQIIVVTKAGYVQGANMRDARQRMDERRPYPDMVEVSTDCWHNISPEFLEEQITRSLARLRLECIDALLLHNPEYFLKANPNRDAYYARIKKAFAFLETEVERKRIRFYGVSSNTFPEAEGKSDFTSLDRIWNIANDIKKNHHFAVIQFPMNLFEPGAAVMKNNAGHTVLERAREYRLGTLINRPLNSFHRDRMLRLTSFPIHDIVEVKGRLHTMLGRIVEMEKRAPAPRGRQLIAWGHVLREKLADLGDLLQWKDALNYQILPQLASSLERIGAQNEPWAQEYRPACIELFQLITQTLEGLANEKAALLGGQLDQMIPDLSADTTITRKVLRVYRSLKGVNCVLVGMRRPGYVDDVLGNFQALPEDKVLTVMSTMHRQP